MTRNWLKLTPLFFLYLLDANASAILGKWESDCVPSPGSVSHGFLWYFLPSDRYEFKAVYYIDEKCRKPYFIAIERGMFTKNEDGETVVAVQCTRKTETWSGIEFEFGNSVVEDPLCQNGGYHTENTEVAGKTCLGVKVPPSELKKDLALKLDASSFVVLKGEIDNRYRISGVKFQKKPLSFKQF